MTPSRFKNDKEDSESSPSSVSSSVTVSSSPYSSASSPGASSRSSRLDSFLSASPRSVSSRNSSRRKRESGSETTESSEEPRRSKCIIGLSKNRAARRLSSNRSILKKKNLGKKEDDEKSKKRSKKSTRSRRSRKSSASSGYRGSSASSASRSRRSRGSTASRRSIKSKRCIPPKRSNSRRPIGEFSMIKCPSVKSEVRTFLAEYSASNLSDFDAFSMSVDGIPFVAVSLMNASSELRNRVAKKGPAPPTPMKKHTPGVNSPRKRRLSSASTASNCCSSIGGPKSKSVRFSDEYRRKSGRTSRSSSAETSQRELGEKISEALVETDRKYHNLWHDRLEEKK